jgi:hypothetical protein
MGHMNEKYQIKFLTGNNWTLIDFEKFIHSINNIYYSLYACNFSINKPVKKSTKVCIFDAIEHKRRFIDINNEYLLSIKSIRMESPGEINLWAGAGEVIHELRELIKDLSYRNKQEYELGQLDILDKKLYIMNKYDIQEFINDDCLTLINFRNKGLLDLGNLIDYKI